MNDMKSNFSVLKSYVDYIKMDAVGFETLHGGDDQNILIEMLSWQPPVLFTCFTTNTTQKRCTRGATLNLTSQCNVQMYIYMHLYM